MAGNEKRLALVTGASSGIGFELAKKCAEEGFDLIVAADGPEIVQAAEDLKAMGVEVSVVQKDLSLQSSVDELYRKVAEGGRPVDLLFANAGQGLSNGFLDQNFDEVVRVINTNITGTIYLVQKIGRDMRQRGEGRILITGSIAGFIPGSFNAVYNATKAFLDNFAYALRNELKDTGVSVTCLMPGPTDTDFFEDADLMDTHVGADMKKEDPAVVAKAGFDALMAGKSGIIPGLKSKMQVGMAKVAPPDAMAERHRHMAEPGSAKH